MDCVDHCMFCGGSLKLFISCLHVWPRKGEIVYLRFCWKDTEFSNRWYHRGRFINATSLTWRDILSPVLCPSGRLVPMCGQERHANLVIADIQPAAFGNPWLFYRCVFRMSERQLALEDQGNLLAIKSKCGTVTLWQSSRKEEQLKVSGELRVTG